MGPGANNGNSQQELEEENRRLRARYDQRSDQWAAKVEEVSLLKEERAAWEKREAAWAQETEGLKQENEALKKKIEVLERTVLEGTPSPALESDGIGPGVDDSSLINVPLASSSAPPVASASDSCSSAGPSSDSAVPAPPKRVADSPLASSQSKRPRPEYRRPFPTHPMWDAFPPTPRGSVVEMDTVWREEEKRAWFISEYARFDTLLGGDPSATTPSKDALDAFLDSAHHGSSLDHRDAAWSYTYWLIRISYDFGWPMELRQILFEGEMKRRMAFTLYFTGKYAKQEIKRRKQASQAGKA